MPDTITLSREDYEALVDARDAAVAMQAVVTGAVETLGDAELDEYLAASTPLAFWRRRRGQTQAGLAAAAGISQAYLAQIEAGRRLGDVHLYARLAKLLRLRMEDLVPDEAEKTA